MSYKIAVASSDGKVVNEHFGRATQFLVFLIEDQKYEFLELRRTSPFCNFGTHDDKNLAQAVESLKDCRAVLVSQIGNAASNSLTENFVEPFSVHDFIDNALKKLIKHYDRIDKIKTSSNSKH